MKPFQNIAFAIVLLVYSVLNCYSAQPNSASHISGQMFKRGGEYYHAFLSVAELYSDNIYNTHTGKESDSITRITPGVWVMVPGGKERLPETATASVTPGGVVVGSMGSESFRRLKAYAFYSPEFEIFANNTDQNTQSHHAEGSVEYHLVGGLSLGILEQYRNSHDARGSGITSITTDLDKYMTNLLRLFASYDVSSRIRMEVNYADFYVDYDADRNAFRNRNDTTLSGAFFYRLFSKTSVFGEYEYLKIQYDQDNDLDGDEKHIFGGVRWRATGKSGGMIKGGWGIKSYDQAGFDQEKTLIFQAQVDHHFTDKTGVVVSASRRTNESNLYTSNYSIAENMRIAYFQKIRDKITATLGAAYTRDSYNEDFRIDNISRAREDELYDITAGLSYAFRKWLTAGMQYRYSQRDSNFSEFSYTTNEILFKLSGSL